MAFDQNNPALYTKVREKNWIAHICKPKAGTVVELRAGLVRNRKIGAKIINVDPNMSQQAYGNLQEKIKRGIAVQFGQNDPRYLFAGVIGDIRIATLPEIVNQGFVLTANGTKVQLNAQTIARNMTKDGYIPWTALTHQANKMPQWAQLVPMAMTKKNPILRCGRGDVIVAPDMGGMPNLGMARVWNGELFALEFEKCDKITDMSIAGKPTVTIQELPRII